MAESPDDLRWLLTGDLPCLGCKYNMRGLVGPVIQCPECGYANDLRIPDRWKAKDLPLGVTKREHWPATSVGISIVAALVVPISFSFGFVGLIAGLVFLGWWLWTCFRWVHSASDRLWAIGILALTHIFAWGMLLGWPWAAVMLLNKNFTVLAIAVFVIAMSIGGMIWIKKKIEQADSGGNFRQDWRTWRIPTQEAGEADPPDSVE